MIVTISQATLSGALATVAKAVSKTADHPILAGVLMVAEGGTLEMRTCGDASVRAMCQAIVEEDGATVLPAAVMARAVKGMRDGAVTIESTKGAATVRCGRTTFRLNALDPADFPDFPEVDGATEATIPGAAFCSMVGMAARASGDMPGRPLLAGVHVSLSAGRLTMTATDSYRAAICSTEVDVDAELSAVIPARTLQEVAAASDGRDVTVVVGDRQARLSVCGTTFVTRVLEGRYPDVSMMMPKSSKTEVTVDAVEMADAVRRASLVGSKSVILTAGGDEVLVEASSPDKGEAREPVSADVEGEAVRISLADRFLLDGLTATDGELMIGLDGSMQPAVMRAWGDVAFEYLLMPMRIQP